MPAPRAVKGPEGSRILLELVDPDEDDYDAELGYVLLLNYDDGDREWQTYQWKNLTGHGTLGQQIKNCHAKDRDVTKFTLGGGCWYVYGTKRNGPGNHHWWGGGIEGFTAWAKGENGKDKPDITNVALTEDSWVAVNGTCGYSYYGIAEFLQKKIKEIHKQSGTINNICLSRSNSGGYWILYNGTATQFWNLGEHLTKEVEKGSSHTHGKVLHVCEASNGAWVVLRERWYIASTGVPQCLKDALQTFYNGQLERRKERDRAITRYNQQQAREKAAAKRKAEEEEARKKREEEERVAKRRRLQNDFSASAERLKSLSKDLAQRHGWSLVTCNEASRVIEFERTPRYAHREKIQVFFTTRTVGTCVNHPRQGATQMFRRLVTDEQLSSIFEDPRTHTGKGYQIRSQMPLITTPSSGRGDRSPAQGASELECFSNALIGCHVQVDPVELDANFGHFSGLAFIKQREAEYYDLDLSKGEVLVRLFCTANTGCKTKLGMTLGEWCCGFPSVASFNPPHTLKHAGIKSGDVILSIRISCNDWSFDDVKDRCPYMKDVVGAPYRLGVLRDGVRHDIIVTHNNQGLVGYGTVDSDARPLTLRPTADLPLEKAGLRRGDRLIDVCVPAAEWGNKGDALGMFPPNTMCTVAVFRKAS